MPDFPLCTPEPAAIREAGLDVPRAQRITNLLHELVAQGRVNGMALRVQRRGQVLDWTVGTRDTAHRHPFDAHTLVRLYSISKPMTSMLLFALFEEGHWSFDDPITRFLPELADLRVAHTDKPPSRPIVMRDLLLHQAGFAYGIGDTHDVEQRYRAARVLDFGAPLETLLARVAGLPLANEPGQARYSIAHDLLGLIAQRITGRPLATLMHERLFQPLGMEGAGFAVDPSQLHRLASLHRLNAEGCCRPIDGPDAGAAHWALAPAPALHSGGAGVVAALEDVSRFLGAIAGRTRPGHAAVLAPATLGLLKAGTQTPSTQRPGASMTPGWWTRLERPADSGSCAAPGSLFTNGNGGSFAWIDAARDLCVVGLLNVTGWQPGDAPMRLFDPLVYQALSDAS